MKSEESVVYLILYSGDVLPPFYIGQTYKEIYNNDYYGSPQQILWKDKFKSEIREHPERFDKIIISEHPTRKEALEQELYYQKFHNVVEQDLFFNESYACKNGCFGNRRISIASRKGKESHCKNRVWCNNGKISKMFFKDSIPDGWVIGRSNYDCVKISKSVTGKKKPNWKWITDGKSERKINILVEDIPAGWQMGRIFGLIEKMCNSRVRTFKWYQNDILKHSIRIYEDEKIPENYYPGRTYYSLKNESL